MLFIFSLLFLGTTAFSADDWPQFRGPDGQGHSSAKNVPLTWSETQNIAWKTPLPGLGWSSPAVAAGQIWVTAAIEEDQSLHAICLDRRSGQIVHDVEVFRKPDLGRIAAKNSHASPTPVVDGDHVYVHFGAHGTACLSTDGQIVWSTVLAYNHHHGPGGSPIVWRDLLIIACDGFEEQNLVALDKQSGKIRWKQPRTGQMAYSTPLIVRVGSADQIISNYGDAVAAFAPSTGAEIWRLPYEGHSVVPRPVAGNGLVYVCSGYWTPTLYCIRPDGQGDITDTQVVGKVHRGVPHNPSPILVDQRLLMVNDMGLLTCVDAERGQELWRKRLGGKFSASPVHAAGRLYLVDEDAKTLVLSASEGCELLAENALDGRALASPAICEGVIYLRTDAALYAISEGQPRTAARAKLQKPRAAKVK